MKCLEIGCGGGDLAFDMARIVGPSGSVLGTDIDEKKIELASKEATEQKLNNVEFRFSDITQQDPGSDFDLVHARFVLTHLVKPSEALARVYRSLRPGGILVVEDIEFRGYFCYPESPALRRYVELYMETVSRRGADPNIGPRLPAMLIEADFENVRMNVVQPAGIEGEVKLISPLTMENIADSVLAEGLASRDETDRIVRELYEYARTPGAVGCMPRVFESWGNKSKT
jgi:SAM-dependent methyltransferase